MIRLHAIVEGATEERFVKDVLTDHLAGYQVYADVCCVETGRTRHRADLKHKGGVTTYSHLRRDIKNRIAGDNHADCRFTTMIDFYRLPNDFPGYDKLDDQLSKYEQIKLLEDSLAADIDDKRFIPYIQLHEFESFIFVNPEVLELQYFDREAEIKQLVDVLLECPNPELINDGWETAPSKRIIKLIPEYAGNKPLGAQLASVIGLNDLRQKCKHFNEWISQLEALNK